MGILDAYVFCPLMTIISNLQLSPVFKPFFQVFFPELPALFPAGGEPSLPCPVNTGIYSLSLPHKCYSLNSTHVHCLLSIFVSGHLACMRTSINIPRMIGEWSVSYSNPLRHWGLLHSGSGGVCWVVFPSTFRHKGGCCLLNQFVEGISGIR